eukprot:GHVS01042204.1.p1 GENE.GHVS01042204.1~~GHVS01042204.1.p1  ORF type:complete len:537 (+),score=78.21 GHVS01042204.1:183-1793(+)
MNSEQIQRLQGLVGTSSATPLQTANVTRGYGSHKDVGGDIMPPPQQHSHNTDIEVKQEKEDDHQQHHVGDQDELVSVGAFVGNRVEEQQQGALDSAHYDGLVHTFCEVMFKSDERAQSDKAMSELLWLCNKDERDVVAPSNDTYRSGSRFDALVYEESLFALEFQRTVSAARQGLLAGSIKEYWRKRILHGNRILYLAKSKLDRERQMLRKKQKLHWAMLNSKFNGFPILQKGFRLLNMVGKGGFAEVWEAFDPCDLSVYAAKLHMLSPEMDPQKRWEVVECVKQEITIHQCLNYHPNIVNMSACFEMSDDLLVTILELCSGDLDNYLKRLGPLPESLALAWTKKILVALKFMKKTPGGCVHHCDLKPGNILLRSGDVKLADFGLSKLIPPGEDPPLFTGSGTLWYQPPECLGPSRDKVVVSDLLDVWAVGCILFEMLFLRRPFDRSAIGGPQMNNRRVSANIVLEGIRAGPQITTAENNMISPQAKELLLLLLSDDPHKRPHVEELLGHPSLSELPEDENTPNDDYDLMSTMHIE